MHAEDIVPIITALGVFATAIAAIIAAASSLRNGKIVDKVHDTTLRVATEVGDNTKTANETRDKVTRITMDVDGRFSATQEQLSRVIEHVFSINPEIIARAALAAKDVLATAERTREDLKLAIQPAPPK